MINRAIFAIILSEIIFPIFLYSLLDVFPDSLLLEEVGKKFFDLWTTESSDMVCVHMYSIINLECGRV